MGSCGVGGRRGGALLHWERPGRRDVREVMGLWRMALGAEGAQSRGAVLSARLTPSFARSVGETAPCLSQALWTRR